MRRKIRDANVGERLRDSDPSHSDYSALDPGSLTRRCVQ
jgi:hypothetical protein